MKTKKKIIELSEINSDKCYSRENVNWNVNYNAYIDGYEQCQEDMAKDLYEFGKLVLDTFHSEGKTHSCEDRLARVKFDEWFKTLNK